MTDAGSILSSWLSVLFLVLLTLLFLGADLAPSWAKSKSILAFVVLLAVLAAKPTG